MELRKLELKTDRLVLSPIKQKDKDGLIDIVCQDEVKKTYMLPDLVNEEEKDKFFMRLKTISENIERFVYGIHLKDEIIGFLNEVDKGEDYIEVGYFIGHQYWNNGYASEALKAAINELFRIGYKVVKAAHFEINPASGRVMQKCGMTISGEEEIIEYRGNNRKAIYYSINNPIK